MSRLSELDPFRPSSKSSLKSPSSKDNTQPSNPSSNPYSSLLYNQPKSLKFTYPTSYKPNHIGSFSHQKPSNNDPKKHPAPYQSFSLKYTPPKSQSEKVTPIKALAPISSNFHSSTPNFTPTKSTNSYKRFQPKNLSYLEMTQPFASNYNNPTIQSPRNDNITSRSIKSVESEIKDRLAKIHSAKHSPASSPWIKSLKSPSSSQGTPQLLAQTINTDILRISLEKQLEKGFKKRKPASQIGTPTRTDMSDFASEIMEQFEHRTKIIEESENIISKYSSPKGGPQKSELIIKKDSKRSSAIQSPKSAAIVNKQLDFDLEEDKYKEFENDNGPKDQIIEDEEVIYLDQEEKQELENKNKPVQESENKKRFSLLESSFKGMDVSRESPELSKASTLEVLFDKSFKEITSETPTPEFSKVLVSRSGSMNIYDTLKKRKASHLKLDSKHIESPENSKDEIKKNSLGSSPDFTEGSVSSPVRCKITSIENIQQALPQEEEEFELENNSPEGDAGALRGEQPEQMMKVTPRFPSARGGKNGELRKTGSLKKRESEGFGRDERVENITFGVHKSEKEIRELDGKLEDNIKGVKEPAFVDRENLIENMSIVDPKFNMIQDLIGSQEKEKSMCDEELLELESRKESNAKEILDIKEEITDKATTEETHETFVNKNEDAMKETETPEIFANESRSIESEKLIDEAEEMRHGGSSGNISLKSDVEETIIPVIPTIHADLLNLENKQSLDGHEEKGQTLTIEELENNERGSFVERAENKTESNDGSLQNLEVNPTSLNQETGQENNFSNDEELRGVIFENTGIQKKENNKKRAFRNIRQQAGLEENIPSVHFSEGKEGIIFTEEAEIQKESNKSSHNQEQIFLENVSAVEKQENKTELEDACNQNIKNDDKAPISNNAPSERETNEIMVVNAKQTPEQSEKEIIQDGIQEVGLEEKSAEVQSIQVKEENVLLDEMTQKEPNESLLLIVNEKIVSFECVSALPVQENKIESEGVYDQNIDSVSVKNDDEVLVSNPAYIATDTDEIRDMSIKEAPEHNEKEIHQEIIFEEKVAKVDIQTASERSHNDLQIEAAEIKEEVIPDLDSIISPRGSNLIVPTEIKTQSENPQSEEGKYLKEERATLIHPRQAIEEEILLQEESIQKVSDHTHQEEVKEELVSPGNAEISKEKIEPESESIQNSESNLALIEQKAVSFSEVIPSSEIADKIVVENTEIVLHKNEIDQPNSEETKTGIQIQSIQSEEGPSILEEEVVQEQSQKSDSQQIPEESLHMKDTSQTENQENKDEPADIEDVEVDAAEIKQEIILDSDNLLSPRDLHQIVTVNSEANLENSERRSLQNQTLEEKMVPIQQVDTESFVSEEVVERKSSDNNQQKMREHIEIASLVERENEKTEPEIQKLEIDEALIEQNITVNSDIIPSPSNTSQIVPVNTEIPLQQGIMESRQNEIQQASSEEKIASIQGLQIVEDLLPEEVTDKELQENSHVETQEAPRYLENISFVNIQENKIEFKEKNYTPENLGVNEVSIRQEASVDSDIIPETPLQDNEKDEHIQNSLSQVHSEEKVASIQESQIVEDLLSEEVVQKEPQENSDIEVQEELRFLENISFVKIQDDKIDKIFTEKPEINEVSIRQEASLDSGINPETPFKQDKEKEEHVQSSIAQVHSTSPEAEQVVEDLVFEEVVQSEPQENSHIKAQEESKFLENISFVNIQDNNYATENLEIHEASIRQEASLDSQSITKTPPQQDKEKEEHMQNSISQAHSEEKVVEELVFEEVVQKESQGNSYSGTQEEMIFLENISFVRTQDNKMMFINNKNCSENPEIHEVSIRQERSLDSDIITEPIQNEIHSEEKIASPQSGKAQEETLLFEEFPQKEADGSLQTSMKEAAIPNHKIKENNQLIENQLQQPLSEEKLDLLEQNDEIQDKSIPKSTSLQQTSLQDISPSVAEKFRQPISIVISSESLELQDPKSIPSETKIQSQENLNNHHLKPKKHTHKSPNSRHYKHLSIDLPNSPSSSTTPTKQMTPSRQQDYPLLSSVLVNISPKKASLMKKGIIIMDDNMTEGSSHQEDPNFCKEYYTDSRVSESCSLHDIEDSSRGNSPSRFELISFEEFNTETKERKNSQASPKRPTISLQYDENYLPIEKKRSTKDSVEINISQIPFNISNMALSAEFNVSGITKNEHDNISSKNLSMLMNEQNTEISAVLTREVSQFSNFRKLSSQENDAKFQQQPSKEEFFGLSKRISDIEVKPNTNVSEAEKTSIVESNLANSAEFNRLNDKDGKSLMKQISTLESIDREFENSLNHGSFHLPSNLSLTKIQEFRASTSELEKNDSEQGLSEDQSNTSPTDKLGRSPVLVPAMKFDNLMKVDFENISLTSSIIVFDNNIYYSNKEQEKKPSGFGFGLGVGLVDDLNPVTEERSLEMTQSEETSREAKRKESSESENKEIAKENLSIIGENALKEYFNRLIPEAMTFRSKAIDTVVNSEIIKSETVISGSVVNETLVDGTVEISQVVEEEKEGEEIEKMNPKVLRPLMSFGDQEEEDQLQSEKTPLEENKSFVLPDTFPTDPSAQDNRYFDTRNLSDISEVESLNNTLETPKRSRALSDNKPSEISSSTEALKESLFPISQNEESKQQERLPRFGSSIFRQQTVPSMLSSNLDKPLSDNPNTLSGSNSSHDTSKQPTTPQQPTPFRNSIFKSFTMAQTLMMNPDLSNGMSSPMSNDKFTMIQGISRNDSQPSDQGSSHKKQVQASPNMFRLTSMEGPGGDLMEERKSIDTRGSQQRSMNYRSLRKSFIHKNLLQSQLNTEEIMANSSKPRGQNGREDLSNITAKSSGEVSERFSLSDVSLTGLHNDELNISSNVGSQKDISVEFPQENFLKNLNFDDSLLLPTQLSRNESDKDSLYQYDVSMVFNENIGRIETYKKLGNQVGCIKLLKELAYEIEKQEKLAGDESPENQKDYINYKFYKIQIFNMLSLEYYEQKSYEEALDFTNKAIELDRYNIQALYKSYQIHVKLKKDAEAKSILKRVRKLMQLQPMSSSVQNMKLDNISIPSAVSSSTNGSFYEGLQNAMNLSYCRMNGGDWGKSLSRFKPQQISTKIDEGSNSGQ